MPGRNPIADRVIAASWSGVKIAAKTVLFLVGIIIPVTLCVAFLSWTGLLERVAAFLGPAMGAIGLPGDAALVLLSSVFLNIYSAIAVMGGLGSIGLREATILAIMCLSAHNMIVETAVMRKTGSSAVKMVLLRLGVAVFAAWFFNLILPHDMGRYAISSAASSAGRGLADAFKTWAVSSLTLVLKISIIVLLIMVLQRLLEEFKITDVLSKIFAPFMRFFGLPPSASFLWIVINVVGYAYGAGLVMEEVKAGKMKRNEADLFNHHAGVCHSLLEDTTLYAVAGIPILLITLPRLALAIVVVHAERVRRVLFRHSFRVGTH